MGTMSSAGKEPCLRVIHNLSTRVGGVEVPIHCFVVEAEGHCLIFGCPWKQTIC